MLGDSRCDKEEKQARGNVIDGAIRNAIGMAGEDDDRMVNEADESVTSMRKGDAIANAGAVELLALVKGAQKDKAGFRLAGEFGDLTDQFAQDGFAVEAGEIQINRGG